MSEVKTYRLRFIRDLCDVPLDNLDDCLTDLRQAILAVHTMRMELGDLSNAVTLPDEIEWLDDDERSATLHANTQSGRVFSVHVEPARPTTGEPT